MTPPPDSSSSPLLQAFLVYGVPILATGLLLAFTALAGAGALWWAERRKQSKLWGAIDLVKTYALDALLYTGSGLKKEYETLVADGDLSTADRARLRQRGLELVRLWLGQKKLGLLEKGLSMGGAVLDTWLGAQVDAAVVKLASTSGGVTLPVEPPGLSAAAAAALPTPPLGVPVVKTPPSP